MSINRAIEPAINLIESVVLPKVDVVTLDNGVQVHVINAGEQEVVKIELLFKAGKWFETKNLVSDFTNRMLREGTEKRTGKEIADIFDYHGANVNYGSAYETAGAVMYSLSHKAETLVPLLYEVFTEATFPENEYDTIANNRKQRLKVDLEKNDFVANRTFVDALYGQKHPYGRITKFEDFDTMSPADLRSFYKQYYNPANLTIIVSGQVKDSLLKELNKYFGSTSWKGEKANDTIGHPTEQSAQLVHHIEKADSVQSAVMVGNISINKTHPDFLKLSVLNTVFGGYFGSRLMSNIREEKGYTYGIYSSFASYPHGGFLEIATEVGKGVRDNTLKEIEFEINDLRNNLIDEEELQIVKNYMSGKILRSIDGPLKLSETIKGLIIYGQTTDYIHNLLKTVREVKAEELHELAKKYLDYDKMYKITVG